MIYKKYNIRLCKSQSGDTCPGNILINTIKYNTSVIESAFIMSIFDHTQYVLLISIFKTFNLLDITSVKLIVCFCLGSLYELI